MPERWRGDAVTLAVALFLGIVAVVLLFGSGLRPVTVAAMSLFAGGCLSNLLDRAILGGNVIDFLNIGWGGFRTCVFNVADVAIVLGATVSLLMAAGAFFGLVVGRSADAS